MVALNIFMVFNNHRQKEWKQELPRSLNNTGFKSRQNITYKQFPFQILNTISEDDFKKPYHTASNEKLI